MLQLIWSRNIPSGCTWINRLPVYWEYASILQYFSNEWIANNQLTCYILSRTWLTRIDNTSCAVILLLDSFNVWRCILFFKWQSIHWYGGHQQIYVNNESYRSPDEGRPGSTINEITVPFCFPVSILSKDDLSWCGWQMYSPVMVTVWYPWLKGPEKIPK